MGHAKESWQQRGREAGRSRAADVASTCRERLGRLLTPTTGRANGSIYRLQGANCSIQGPFTPGDRVHSGAAGGQSASSPDLAMDQDGRAVP